MTIESIPLIPPTLCLQPSTTQLEALHRLLELGINHAPVCESETWVGLITLHDLLGEVLPVSARMEDGLMDLSFVGDATGILTAHLKDMAMRTVGQVVRRDVPTLRRDHSIVETAFLLYRHAMPLPVLASDGHLLGMLSARALMGYLNETSGV